MSKENITKGMNLKVGNLDLASLPDALIPDATNLTQSLVQPPLIVATPPSDAGRGLIRIGNREIRHYSGDKKPLHYLVSRDNGLTWSDEEVPQSYPPNFGGVTKESPAFTCNPNTNEFLRIQPVEDFIFVSKGGLDGSWFTATIDGMWSGEWDKKHGDLLSLSGILRSPLFIDNGKRLLVPSHEMRKGIEVHISEDGGLKWHKSKSVVNAPRHQAGGEHKGVRWYNAGAEASIVELEGGKLWMLFRTSQDQHYQSFSTDKGETWSEGEPSHFFGTLTMPTIGKLKDGRLLMLWTNTQALPELETAVDDMWEDVFTNRDSHHAAISSDNGKTWIGFRELILDEHRNRSDYATFGGPEDRGKHQSEFVQLDDNRVLVSIGQHRNHRRLVIVDMRWLAEKSRTSTFEDGLNDWTHHTYIPVIKGHASYNRKSSALLIAHPEKPGAKVMKIAFLDDPELMNEKTGADYRQGGATWNFPNGEIGRVYLRLQLPEGSGGARFSIADRLFNACDADITLHALYTIRLSIGETFGSETLRADTWYDFGIHWNGVTKGSTAEILLNNKPVGTLPLNYESPNGASYLHMISTANETDAGLLVETVSACVE
ncbi:sialidase family protein [Sporosarcina sp. YIM B06819]|uniref:sialidase family protein n=1 Tax=Sporosarcina sp. YIM B06819 TaxID=3081769 RepID=UPI00298C8294|nr:sialidase family protein [Sporosarcina sp. YIM B06819]